MKRATSSLLESAIIMTVSSRLRTTHPRPCEKKKYCSVQALGTFECRSCSREFSSVQGQYLDLTLSGSKSPRAPSFTSRYADNRPASTQIFRSSSVSFAYERGWRQSFAWAGFPGVDTEFGYAMDYIQSCNDQGETRKQNF